MSASDRLWRFLETRLRYDEPQGSFSLRSALQSYLWRARGIRCTSDEIVIVNGSQQGLDLCARLFLDPGDRFAIENPGYLLARNAFLAAGGIAVPVPVDEDGLVTGDLPAARLAYVTPSHQYPLGSTLSAARRLALIAWAARTDAQIIEDDYDGEYRHDVAPLPSLRSLAPDKVVYVGTFSKTLSPSLRIGYLVVPAALRRAFVEAKRMTDRHSPLMEQDALADLLTSGAYERHVRSVRRRNGQRRAVLLAALAAELGPDARVVGAGSGLHVVVWFDRIAADRMPALLELAREAGVGLYPVSPLYDPDVPSPAEAGLVLGYAGLETEAARRGVRVIATIIADQPSPPPPRWARRGWRHRSRFGSVDRPGTPQRGGPAGERREAAAETTTRVPLQPDVFDDYVTPWPASLRPPQRRSNAWTRSRRQPPRRPVWSKRNLKCSPRHS